MIDIDRGETMVLKKVMQKAKQDVVLTAAWVLAVGSAFLIPPDQQSGIFYKNRKPLYPLRKEYGISERQFDLSVLFFQHGDYQ